MRSLGFKSLRYSTLESFDLNQLYILLEKYTTVNAHPVSYKSTSKEVCKLEKLKMILSASERAASLNQKLIAFSCKGKNYSTPIDVHAILKDAVQLLKHSIDKQITITTNMNASLFTIIGDPAQIQNAIINLGINAWDAIGDTTGTISIRTENISLSDEYCKKQQNGELEPGNYIEITVEDNGCGMDRETVQHIFEPFFTTKEVGKGTGLGLAAVFGIVKDHGGEVAADSEIGNGTQFRILLPLTDQSKSKPMSEDKQQIIQGKGTILIIDDEEFMRSIADSQLTNAGYTTMCASNGRIGLDIYLENWKEIDLVLLDMVMPIMSGRECLVEILKVNPGAKVVMCSGFTGEIRAQEMSKAGAKAFLAKPYRVSELTSIVYKVLQM